ncbi:MAG: hypothetical protein JWM07_185 [Candidatus Saccharibacteria bacterium]|nr:hypothetical protein [Candidatus Saccharibacteria bacterium]
MSVEKNTDNGVSMQIILQPVDSHQDTDGFQAYAPHTTFGLSAVKRHDRIVGHLLDGAEIEDELERHLAAQERAVNKITPRDGQVMYALGKIARRSVDKDDWQILSDPFRQPELLEKAVYHHAIEYYKEHSESDDELDKIRYSLQGLDAAESAALSKYMTDNAASFLRQSKDVNAPEETLSWQDWLAKKATNEQLLNILQWHAHVSGEQLTHPEINEQIAGKKAVFKEMLPHLIDAGILAPQASSAIKSIDAINVRINDVFDTLIKGRAGYHTSGTEYVVIQQGTGATADERYRSLSYNIDDVTFHELTHATLANNYNVGNEVMDARWLNETLTERIAQLFKELDAGEDYQGMPAYWDEDRLLTRMLDGDAGGVAVDMTVATRAYSGGKQELADFTSALDDAWGTDNALAKISTMVATVEAASEASGVSRQRERQIQAVHVVANLLELMPERVFDR